MKKHSSYVPIESAVPFKGLASTLPADRLTSGLASDLLNVVVRDGIVRRRPGYFKLGQTLLGIPLDFQEFAKIGSSEVLVCFTSKAQYWYDAPNNNWVDISFEKTDSFAADGTHTTNAFVHENADIEDQFESGSRFVIVGSVSNDGTYNVTSTSFSTHTTINVSEAVPDTSDATGNIITTKRHTLTGANAGNDSFLFAGDATSYISAGDTVWIKNSASNDGLYTVASVSFSNPTTTVFVDEDFSSSSTSGYLTAREVRTYTDGDYLNSVPATDISAKRLIHTNGVDNPIQWFGDTGDLDGNFMRWAPDLPDFVTCKALAVFKEHLFMGDIQAGTSEPQLIGWSDSGIFDDFSDGNSGTQILYELATGIQQLITLGDRLIIYSKDALASGIFIGGTFIFAFETIIPAGTRLASAKGITSINVGHVYASEENFYLFDGSRGLRALADIIRTDYKAQRSQDSIFQMATLNDFSKRTIYISIPTLDALGLVYTMEYDSFDLRNRAWSKEQYSHRPRAFGFFTNTFVYTWDDTVQELILAIARGYSNDPISGVPQLKWSDEIGPWANEGEQVDFPVRIFGDEDGNVYASNEGTISDHGTIKAGFWTSGDFTVPGEFISTEGRWGEIEFEASGDDIAIEAHADFGSRLAHSEVVSLEGSIKKYRVPIDITSRTLRVRFSFSGAFELRWLRVWVKSTSARS